jgi:hypothetical protein
MTLSLKSVKFGLLIFILFLVVEMPKQTPESRRTPGSRNMRLESWLGSLRNLSISIFINVHCLFLLVFNKERYFSRMIKSQNFLATFLYRSIEIAVGLLLNFET